jgi:hypothetical protein
MMSDPHTDLLMSIRESIGRIDERTAEFVRRLEATDREMATLRSQQERVETALRLKQEGIEKRVNTYAGGVIVIMAMVSLMQPFLIQWLSK